MTETLAPVDLVYEYADLLVELTYRERRVLEMRYGAHGAEMRTLADVAALFNVGLGRAEEIERRALVHLRELVERYGWREAVGTAIYAGGVLRSFTGADGATDVPLGSIEYDRAFREGSETRYLCPPPPVGLALRVDPRSHRWRHTPIRGGDDDGEAGRTAGPPDAVRA